MIKQAIKSRIANAIMNGSFKTLIYEIDKLVICSGIFAGLFYADFIKTIDFKQYEVFVGGFIILNVYVFFDKIVSLFVYLRKHRPEIKIDFEDFVPKKQHQHIINTSSIDGIEKNKLIDFILKQNGFPFIKAKSVFGMFPKEYKKLGDNLERVGILERGENNSRVLKEKVDRELLEKVISQSDSDNIVPPLLQEGNSFTFQTI